MRNQIVAASKNGDLKTVKKLLEKGASVDTRDDKTSYSILHLASFGGHEDVVKLLLQKGANAIWANDYGNTPLHTASKNGHTKIVKMLLDHGADPNIKNGSGRTPLHNPGEEPAIAKLLLERGANVNHRESNGWTALHMLCLNNGTPEVVKVLLEHGANVNYKDTFGHTALHLLCLNNGTPELVRVLLEHGIDRHAEDWGGKTAFECTTDQKILDLLESCSIPESFDSKPTAIAGLNIAARIDNLANEIGLEFERGLKLNEKVSLIEEEIFGEVQDGKLLNRIESLEKQIK